MKREKGITWTALQLLSAFKGLNILPFYTTSAKWFKNREIAKVSPPPLPFTPTINPQSQVLAESHFKKYIETSMNLLGNSQAQYSIL